MPDRRLAVLRLVLVAAACTGATGTAAPAAGSRLQGEMQGEYYIAPEGRFQVLAPVLPDLGGRIEDTANVVTFSDDTAIHASIACFPLDRAQRWERDTREIRDYLAQFYGSFVLPDFSRRFPGAATESALFTPDLHAGALFVFTLLPGGSAFNGAGSEPLPAAKRGNLLFVSHDSIFVLSIELAERVTRRDTFHKTAAEENEILRERLLQLAQRLRIPASPS